MCVELNELVPRSSPLSVVLLPLTPRELEEPAEKRRVMCVFVGAVMDDAFSTSPTGREPSSLESRSMSSGSSLVRPS